MKDIQLPQARGNRRDIDSPLHKSPAWSTPMQMQRHQLQGRMRPAEPTIDDVDPTARAKAAAWHQGVPYQPAAA